MGVDTSTVNAVILAVIIFFTLFGYTVTRCGKPVYDDNGVFHGHCNRKKGHLGAHCSIDEGEWS